MVIVHSDCVECADGCHHCSLGRKYPHYYCDDCDQESDKLRYVGDDMLCEECIENIGLDTEDYEEVDIDD